MNCQSTCLFARYCFTSLDHEIFLTSTEADLKVFALSVNKFAGSPLRLTNLRNACKKDVTVKLSVNSRWTARVDAHVNRQQYALLRFSCRRCRVDIEWFGKIYPSVRERRSLINTICRQVRGGGSSEWFPLISYAYGAFSDNSLYGFSSLQNPMCFSYSIQCLSDTIVVNMIMSLSDQQFCVSVARR